MNREQAISRRYYDKAIERMAKIISKGNSEFDWAETIARKIWENLAKLEVEWREEMEITNNTRAEWKHQPKQS